MDGESRDKFRARHALPILLTLAALLSLLYRSTNAFLFHRYSLTFLCFYAILIAATVQSWRAALREGGWRAFSRRLAAFPVLQAVVIVACALFLLDLIPSPFEIAASALRGDLPACGLLAIAGAIFGVFCVLIYLLSADPRKLLGKIGVFLASMCISVAVVEAVFRWFLLTPRIPQTEDQFRRIVASRWPDPVTPAKPPATYRILGLSDSFGEAGGGGNYHYLLPQALDGSVPRYEVVNFSVAEYEPADELALLRRFGPDFRPDLVLHGFTVANDFYSPIEPLRGFRGISVRVPAGCRNLRPKNFAVRNWMHRFLVFRRDNDKKKSEEERGFESGSFSREEFLRIERGRMDVCDRGRPEEALLGITRVLDGIREQASRMNAEYVLLIHPDQYQVETDLFREICEQYHLRPERYDLQRPQRLLIEYCRKKGIDYVDLLPAFREQGAGGGLYLFRDTHYNDRGNRLAAAEIAGFLNRRFASKIHGKP